MTDGLLTGEAEHADSRLAGLVIVARSIPPYRAHLHSRIQIELKGWRLWTLVTHDPTDGRWAALAGDVKDTFLLGHSGAPSGSKILGILEDFRVGGRVLNFIDTHAVRVVILCGYSDLGRVRVLLGLRHRGIQCLLAADSNVRGDAKGVRGWLKRRLLTRLLRLCAGVLPFGSLGREYYRSYGVPGEKIFLSPLEPDYAVFREPRPGERDRCSQTWGFSPERRRFLYSGRLVEIKDVDLAIAAFCAVAMERPNWDLVIAGDGPLRVALERDVPAEYRARIHWVGHISTASVMADLYKASDVLLLPSRYEPWGLVVNEAAAAGLAILCSDRVGACPELIRDAVNGYVFKAGDLPTLVQLMRRITEPGVLAAFQIASPQVVAQWREKADPVAGIRAALQHLGAAG